MPKQLSKPYRRKISNALSGIAGEYLVAAELSRRGYIASVTLRNTQGIDILASDVQATKSVGIQVKTNQKGHKRWLMNQKAERLHGANLFYVFVALREDRSSFHVVHSKDVAKHINKSHRTWLKTPGKRGQAHHDSNLRLFEDKKDIFLNRWDLLGL